MHFYMPLLYLRLEETVRGSVVRSLSALHVPMWHVVARLQSPTCPPRKWRRLPGCATHAHESVSQYAPKAAVYAGTG